MSIDVQKVLGQELAAMPFEWKERDIILDERWKELGVAVRLGGEYAIYWVQEFGDPANY